MEENDFEIVQQEEELITLASLLSKSGKFCFDTETTSLDITSTTLVGIAFCINPGKAWYVPFPENQKEAQKRLDIFKGLSENPAIEKTGQNLKFDIGVLKNYNIQAAGKLFDTMLAHYLLEPDMRHNMDLLAETYLGYKTLGIEELIGKKGKT